MTFLELLVSIALTVSIISLVAVAVITRAQAHELEELRKEFARGRRQIQLMQANLRDLRTKADRFIYVPRNNK